MNRLNRRWSKISISYRGGMILAIPAICTIAILTVWSELRNEAIAVHRAIDRTESTIIEANRLLFLLTKAETGVRGYAISQQADFLQSYQKAIADSPSSLNELTDLQRNDALQQDIEEIERLVRGRLNLLQQTIARVEDGSPAEVNELLAQGEVSSDNLAAAIETFKTKHRQMLDRHRQDLLNVRDATNVALWSAAIISLLSFLAALYLFRLLERELNYKQEIVRSRADELASLNQMLARANNTLSERNLELDRFSHLVSHDLKAPLRGIKNISQWIEEDLEGKLPPDTLEYLFLQREKITHMESMIDGLLEYARVGREETPVETVDVRQLLKTIVDSINPPPQFAISIADNMPTIATQKILLERVFSNLIDNAIKHHPRMDGKITIAVDKQEGGYEFAVADDGTGIAPSAQSRVFNIFHTLDRKNRNNTGIGLAIVKKIVEERGGKIMVESTVGSGSTFRFLWSK